MPEPTDNKIGMITLFQPVKQIYTHSTWYQYTPLWVHRLPFAGATMYEYKCVYWSGVPAIDDEHPVICLWHCSDHTNAATYHDPVSPIAPMIDWKNITLYHGFDENDDPVYSTGWSIYEPDLSTDIDPPIVTPAPAGAGPIWVPVDHQSIRMCYFINAWYGSLSQSVPLKSQHLQWTTLVASYDSTETPTYGTNGTGGALTVGGPFTIQAEVKLPAWHSLIVNRNIENRLNAAALKHELFRVLVERLNESGQIVESDTLNAVSGFSNTGPTVDLESEEYNGVWLKRLYTFEPFYPSESGQYRCTMWYEQLDTPHNNYEPYYFEAFTVSVILDDYVPIGSETVYTFDDITHIRVRFSNTTVNAVNPIDIGFAEYPAIDVPTIPEH